MQPFDPKELKWALVTLGLVTSLFLAVCTCRCYPKLKEVCTTDPVERARIRAQFHCESAGATRRGSAMPPLQSIPASNTSSAPRTRKGVVNSKAIPETVQISRFASPTGVIEQQRASDRRRKSYPRSIRCSSTSHSSDLFSVPEANIAPSPGRAVHVSRRCGSEQLANALLSPNAIVRHSKKRRFPTSSPRHHEQYHDKRCAECESQAQMTTGTPVHRRQGNGTESTALSCIQPPASPSSINPTYEQHTTSSGSRTQAVRSESPISERRCSALATIDPSCLHPHNATHPSSSSQQELSCPHLLNLAHQTSDSRRNSSPRNSLQPGREFTAKVRFDGVS